MEEAALKQGGAKVYGCFNKDTKERMDGRSEAVYSTKPPPLACAPSDKFHHYWLKTRALKRTVAKLIRGGRPRGGGFVL